MLTMLNVMACLERADEFDVIHNHTAFEGLATAGLVRTPVLTTLHGGLAGDWLLLFDRYRGWYNTVSRSAKSLLPPKIGFAGVIYNAIDCGSYPFNPGPREDFALYLSRISQEKGTHLAIEVATRSRQHLVIAGNVDDVDQDYFENEVLPRVDGSQIRYVGEADHAAKRELLSRARCLLAPVTWNEPFGLFLVEAMACGTPVIAFRKGSIPEVVEHGVTGYVVDRVEEMVGAIRGLDRISAEACRDRVEKHFDVPRMVDDYLVAYERVVEASSSQRSRVRRLGGTGGSARRSVLRLPQRHDLDVAFATQNLDPDVLRVPKQLQVDRRVVEAQTADAHSLEGGRENGVHEDDAAIPS
jgi:glycosyltransferase involved in cell wall biosynthesis